jgi:Cu/Ag efflux pump CusA
MWLTIKFKLLPHKIFDADIEQYITYPVEIEMAKSELKKFVLFQKFGLSVVTIVWRWGTYLPDN